VIIIGLDPHKRTHTASAVDAGTNAVVATLQIDASLAGYRQLLRWSAQFAERRWAVENARGLGRHLAQWLAARGEAVTDVPSTATARVRELSRGGRRKNDVIDAAAAASVAALHGDANPVATSEQGMDRDRTSGQDGRRRADLQRGTAPTRHLLPGAPRRRRRSSTTTTPSSYHLARRVDPSLEPSSTGRARRGSHASSRHGQALNANAEPRGRRRSRRSTLGISCAGPPHDSALDRRPKDAAARGLISRVRRLPRGYVEGLEPDGRDVARADGATSGGPGATREA
jgi:hypothetical protein